MSVPFRPWSVSARPSPPSRTLGATERQPGLRIGSDVLASSHATAEADFPGPLGPVTRAAGRSIEIACACEVSQRHDRIEPHPYRVSPTSRSSGPSQPAHGGAVRGRDPCRRGTCRGRRSARRPDRQAHRPVARGQVHRVPPVHGSEGLVGTGQSADQRGLLRSPPRPPRRVRRRQGPLCPGLLHRGGRGPPAIASRVHRDRLGERLRAQPVPPPVGRAAEVVRPELHDHLRPVLQGGPRDRRHPNHDGDPGPPRADGDPHRRHRVRRRDQEVRVHGDELPPAGRGCPADAQRGQCRRAG